MSDATLTTELDRILHHEPNTSKRILRRAEIGTVLHQGDVYLHRVAEGHPRGKKLGTRQVAVGDTIGSRHVAEGQNVEVFEGRELPPSFKTPKWCRDAGMGADDVRGVFLGPLIVAGGGRKTLVHPEHAHHEYPAGCWQVTYQGDPRTARRVTD